MRGGLRSLEGGRDELPKALSVHVVLAKHPQAAVVPCQGCQLHNTSTVSAAYLDPTLAAWTPHVQRQMLSQRQACAC